MNLKKSIDLTKKIKEEAFKEGFDAVGVARIPGSSRIIFEPLPWKDGCKLDIKQRWNG